MPGGTHDDDIRQNDGSPSVPTPGGYTIVSAAQKEKIRKSRKTAVRHDYERHFFDV